MKKLFVLLFSGILLSACHKDCTKVDNDYTMPFNCWIKLSKNMREQVCNRCPLTGPAYYTGILNIYHDGWTDVCRYCINTHIIKRPICKL